MPYQECLSVRYHQQDDTYYCGAACAQMVLESAGVGLIDQGTLDSTISIHNDIEGGWATAPDGLQWTMNDSKPGSIGLVAAASEDAISRKIVWSIYNRKLPAVALINGKAHWIVVRGFEASAAPTSSADVSYTITAFDINNPSPKLGSSPPPPHGTADTCGSGGEFGFADEHIAYAHWRSSYMTGVPTSSFWEGKFVAVCDPAPPPTLVGAHVLTSNPENGEQILTPERARALARAGLEAYGLFQREAWRKSLLKTNPGDPILVQRLDRADAFYYIVPMQVSRKAVPVLVCVDARFGSYLQSARISDRGGSAFHGLNFDPNAAIETIVGQSISFGPKGRQIVRKEAFALYPTLVWRPCRESMSPYIPFFMVTLGDRRVFIRVDGQLFTSLHFGDSGI